MMPRKSKERKPLDVEWLAALPNYVEGCATCDTVKKIGGPGHWGSRTCKSLSIAAGGFRSHCTCDTCF